MGATQEEAKALVGHTDVRLTSNLYTHALPGRMRTLANGVGDYMAARAHGNTPLIEG
jgi:uncharacterized protein YebE (UPF0316 family)